VSMRLFICMWLRAHSRCASSSCPCLYACSHVFVLYLRDIRVSCAFCIVVEPIWTNLSVSVYIYIYIHTYIYIHNIYMYMYVGLSAFKHFFIQVYIYIHIIRVHVYRCLSACSVFQMFCFPFGKHVYVCFASFIQMFCFPFGLMQNKHKHVVSFPCR
jgi:hypothetical protein